MEIVNRPDPPTGLRRVLWRLPILMYRLRLGRLLGGRFMLLQHVGRVSGKPRQAVLEVVDHDDRGHVAASGFGPRSDWYQNVVKTPDVTIQVGGRAIPVTAVPLSADESVEIMAGYARRHPAAARKLGKLMGFVIDGTAEDYREVGRHVPFVRFTPRAETS